jgi:hypothetical protein
MLKNTGDELRKNNATSTVEKISGIEATKWTFPKSENSQHERTAYQAMVGKWLISANNIELFEYVVKQITAPDEAGASQSLARDKVFSEVTARTKFDGEQFKDRAPQIRWFIDPFGYLDLARVIAEEDQDPDTKQRSNNFAKIVSNSGFDAIKGAAGSAILAAGDLELLHRAFIYAPAVEAAGENKYPKSAAILDLVNRNKISFDPEPWVPENAASYVTLTWNFEKVVNNVHHVVDAVTDQNSFENMLKNIKETNNVDVRKLVECLNNRISIATEIVEPINSNSEKIIIGVGIRQDEKFVQQQVKNFFGAAIKMEKAGDVEIYYEEAIPEEDENFFGLPEEEEAKDAAAAAPQGGDVLEQKFVAVHNGYILISGDKEYLKRIVSAKTQAIGTHADYLRVQTALNKLATADDVSARQFSRLDKVLEANYELLRNNELKSANTMLARSLASVREEAEKRGRKPKEYDPAKMPDYKSVVAPRLGKTGWVLESKPDGWLINSCLLKREAAEAVNKTDTAAEIKPHDNR